MVDISAEAKYTEKSREELAQELEMLRMSQIEMAQSGAEMVKAPVSDAIPDS